MLKIKKIEIEGFRGFTQRAQTIEFKNNVILFYGENHQGKSSALNAIEWCLYGDECIGEKSGIRERVGTGEIAWRVVNDKAKKAQVKLEIEGEQGIFTITRTELKEKGKRKSIKISLPNGIEKEGEEAEKEIAKLLQISFKDFATTVYQHQETIHDFVIQKPSEQSEAMDRLLGLHHYRNILDGIKKSEISNIQKELAQEFEKFQIRAEEVIKIRRNDLKEKKNKAKEKGLSEEELDENGLLRLEESTLTDINTFAHLLGLTPKEILQPSDWKNTEQFITEVKSELKRLWSESPEVKKQSELEEKRSKANSLKIKYETKNNNLKSVENNLKDFEQKNGNKEEINDRIKKADEKIKATDEEIRQISPKAKLIEEGISILERAAPPDADVCPLCGERVPNLLDHLRKEWKEKIELQVEELKNRKREIEKEKTNLERLRKEHDSLSQDVEREKNNLKDIINAVSTFLGKELRKEDDPVAILSREINNATTQLKDIGKAIEDKRAKLDAISEKIDKIKLLYEILLLKDKLEQINLIQNTKEYQEQDNIRTRVSSLVGEVEDLGKILKLCMKKEAEEKINSARRAIDYYFRKITNNPAFQEIQIRVEEDRRTGGNLYIFEDQDGRRPIPILSQGDLNSLALAIFLGLVKTLKDSHPLGFILMDDPSQSLSSEQKARLVDVLDEVSEIKNIIVSTMDAELLNSLKEIPKKKTTYKFLNWTPDSGPNISEE